MANIIKVGDIEDQCFYCGNSDFAIQMMHLASIIEAVFERHFELAPEEQSDFWSTGDQDGDPFTWLVEGIAGVSPRIAEDIQRILSDVNSDLTGGPDNRYHQDNSYIEISYREHEWDLDLFFVEISIIEQGRFFNKRAASFLDSIFEGLADHQTINRQSVIVDIGPGNEISSLYRARVFKTEKSVEEALQNPEKNLGPPPSQLATSGRMNALGVSVFYGSTDPEVARAEVRPSTGSWEVISRFLILRPLKLLDLEALRKVIVRESFFNQDFESVMRRAYLLHTFHDQ